MKVQIALVNKDDYGVKLSFETNIENVEEFALIQTLFIGEFKPILKKYELHFIVLKI